MLDVTFMGHQGWLFRTERASLMVDTVLSDAFGHGTPGAKMWPPRVIDLAQLPALDAVFFSHEHSDHFDVPTLAKLDRKTPILLPARSSRAARALLDEMGFAPRYLTPGDVVTVGDLELLVFSPDHVATNNLDEWDVLPFAVRDTAGDGSFACFVDVTTPVETETKMVEALGGRVGIYALTNNSTSSLQFAGGISAAPFDTLRMLGLFADWYAAFSHRHGDVEALLLCGAGFSFDGDLAWMNANHFPADNDVIAAMLAGARPHVLTRALVPGETVRMTKGRVERVDPRTPFITTAPRSAWPKRACVGDVKLLAEVNPLVGARSISEADLPELEALLDDLAKYLYGGVNFRALYSIDRATIAGRKPSLAVVLRADDGAYVFEWDPQACQFTGATSDDPTREYVLGIEMWASDLLAVARGEVEWITVQAGHMRAWNMAPESTVLNAGLLMTYFTALRRPDLFLALYRRALAAHANEAPRTRAGGAPIGIRSVDV